jgi:hypothetical protein
MISELSNALDQYKNNTPIIDNKYRVVIKIGEGRFAK